MNATLALVTALKSFSPADLERLLTLRLGSASGLHDWFDVADALQTATSIDRGLARLPRPLLVNARETSPSAQTLNAALALGLGTVDGILPAVTARIAEVTAQVTAEVGAGQTANAPAVALTETKERASQEAALAFTGRVDELLDFIAPTGLRSLARGGVTSAEIARVDAELGELPGSLSEIVELLSRALLVTRAENMWRVSDLTQWHEASAIAKWSLLARAWRDDLGPDLVQALLDSPEWGDTFNSYLSWLFPLDSSWIVTLWQSANPMGKLLGMHLNGTRTDLATRWLSGHDAKASDMLEALQPSFVDKVLLQSDLSIVAPGPLRNDLDARLRSYASVESRSMASTYRLRSALLSHALESGQTPEEIMDFLENLSSTGLPQPVVYLIKDLAAKNGTLRVRSHAGGSTITCITPSLAATLLADTSLTSLALRRQTENILASVFDSNVVMRNLRGAKYPAVLENELGQILPWQSVSPSRPGRPSIGAGTGRAENTPTGAIQLLVTHLAQSRDTDESGDENWQVRQIEVAIRAKARIGITVGLPDGTEKAFVIIPRGLNNGRLRALDTHSDVERTIPVTSITSLSPVA